MYLHKPLFFSRRFLYLIEREEFVMNNLRNWRILRVSGAVVLGLILGMSSAAPGAITTIVSMEIFDIDDPCVPINEIGLNEEFGFRVIVDGPEQGIFRQKLDVTVTSNEITFDPCIWSAQVNGDLLKYSQSGVIQDISPQFNDFGGMGNDPCMFADGDWWFEATCTGIDTLGTLTFQFDNDLVFWLPSGPKIPESEIAWSITNLQVVPEPAKFVFLAISGLIVYRRRRQPRCK